MSESKSRELVFTTLIDLLVQFIFVFTLVLLVWGKNPPPVPPPPLIDLSKPWNVLVNILDVGHIKNPDDQAAAMREKIDELRQSKQELEKRIKELEKRFEGEGQAPGLKRCEVAGRRGGAVIHIRFLQDGNFGVQQLSGRETIYAKSGLSIDRLSGQGLSASILLRELEPLMKYGKENTCTYVASYDYDKGMSADHLEGSRRVIEKLFYLLSTKKLAP